MHLSILLAAKHAYKGLWLHLVVVLGLQVLSSVRAGGCCGPLQVPHGRPPAGVRASDCQRSHKGHEHASAQHGKGATSFTTTQCTQTPLTALSRIRVATKNVACGSKCTGI